jgi:beta-fructofuranosidase
LSAVASVEPVSQSDSSATLHTLGIRPIDDINELRKSCEHIYQRKNISLPSSATDTTKTLCSTSFPTWELEAVITIDPSCCQELGFHFRHNSDMSICTTITFSLRDETISVDKERSTSDPNIRNCPEKGPFTLFYREDNVEPEEILEKLRIRLISDADVLEVFANDRFALATTVYSPEYSSPAGISAFCKGEYGSVLIEEVNIWDGMSTTRR